MGDIFDQAATAKPAVATGDIFDQAAVPQKEGLVSALGSDLWNMLPHSASDAAKQSWNGLPMG